MRPPRPLTLLGVAFVVLLVGGASFATVRAAHPVSARPRPGVVASARPPLIDAALAAATAAPAAITTTAAPEPTPVGVAAELAGPLSDPALGSTVLAQVRDVVTGDVLFDRASATPAPPASTAKLATALAVLAVHASTDRITTTVLAGTVPGQVVLVGAGDPTLSAAPAGTASAYPDAARLSDLAAQVKARGTAVTQVVIDDALFTGPAISPTWASADVPTGYASAITAVMADGGRATPTAAIRSGTPDLAAGQALAADLGLSAAQVSRGSAPPKAPALASVQSAAYGELVQQMLLDSDNVIAECLSRQVALAAQLPASFLGGAAAVRAALLALGTEIGPGMTDGSGLAASDRLTPRALVDVLRLAATATRPGLADVIGDLPVAGWDGTLAGRYRSAPSHAGAGVVRAKTGTLTSVSSLAGVITTAQGRLLIFSFVADRVGPSAADTAAAETALDVMAAALVS